MTNEALVRSIQNGEDRYSELWEQTRRFIGVFAKRFYATLEQPRVDVEDLEQVGFLALCAAARNFSEDGSASFLHYLTFYLRAAFARTVRMKGTDALDRATSLDAPVGDKDLVLSDVVPDPGAAAELEDAEDRIFNAQLREELEDALDAIPEGQAYVVRKYYLDSVPQHMISKELGVSQPAINQKRKAGLRSLRRSRNAARLRAFVELGTPYHWRRGIHVVEDILIRREKLEGEIPEEEQNDQQEERV